MAPTKSDPTEAAIRSAFREGKLAASEELATNYALRLAEAKLASAVRSLDHAAVELLEAPVIYAGNARGAVLRDRVLLVKREVAERLDAVRGELAS